MYQEAGVKGRCAVGFVNPFSNVQNRATLMYGRGHRGMGGRGRRVVPGSMYQIALWRHQALLYINPANAAAH